MADSRSRKSFFMPMLCRLSINDTVQPTKLSDDSSVDPSSPKLSCIGQIKKRSTTNNNNSCNSSNRFLTCRLSASTNGRSSRLNYVKFHRLFSGKNLISPAIDTASISSCSKSVTKSSSYDGRGRKPIISKRYHMTSSGGDQDIMRVVVAEELDPIDTANSISKSVTKRSSSCNGRRRKPIQKNSTSSEGDHDIMRVVVAEELDPPLPVVKCGRRDQESNVNLWKRRGIEMKTLQIQPIKLAINHNTKNNNNGEFSVPISATTF